MPLLSSAQDEGNLTVTVRIYNYAQVSGDMLAEAQRKADAIFSRLGVETEWLHCPLNQEERRRNRACGRPCGPAHFVMYLLPRSMTEWATYAGDSVGVARVRDTSIFMYRVTELARQPLSTGLCRLAVVLGHLMAHELGHLLLGPGSRSSTGIMSYPWRTKQLELAVRGRLFFTREQRERIRAGLRKRLAAGDVD